MNCVRNKTGYNNRLKNNSCDGKLNLYLKGNIRFVHVVMCVVSVKYEKCAVTEGRREAKGV